MTLRLVPLFFICKKNLFVKFRSGLCICKSSEEEPTFIEVLNPDQKNVALGYICCHSHLDLDEFNDY